MTVAVFLFNSLTLGLHVAQVVTVRMAGFSVAVISQGWSIAVDKRWFIF